jgi:hypothetical protein
VVAEPASGHKVYNFDVCEKAIRNRSKSRANRKKWVAEPASGHKVYNFAICEKGICTNLSTICIKTELRKAEVAY